MARQTGPGRFRWPRRLLILSPLCFVAAVALTAAVGGGADSGLVQSALVALLLAAVILPLLAFLLGRAGGGRDLPARNQRLPGDRARLRARAGGRLRMGLAEDPTPEPRRIGVWRVDQPTPGRLAPQRDRRHGRGGWRACSAPDVPSRTPRQAADLLRRPAGRRRGRLLILPALGIVTIDHTAAGG
jgi:hypothetical protein